jgi:cytidine deaminase
MKKPTIAPRRLAELIRAAKKARVNAVCTYSHYPVGAAVLGASGKVYGGCNIESPTLIGHICAERAAIFNALCQGERTITAVCTVSAASEPCGSCRQLIREFGEGDTPIVSLHVGADKETQFETTISRLLPHAHTLDLLNEVKKLGEPK